MDDYLCLTLVAHAGEPEEAFKSRLTAFWTHMLRNHPDDYEKVYAESSHFSDTEGKLSRLYLVEAAVLDALTKQLAAAQIKLYPVDPDDTYSKYEAAPPDWFWIEH